MTYKLLPRTINVLQNMGNLDDAAIRDPIQVAAKVTYLQLVYTPNCGKKTIGDITSWLATHGLQLKGTPAAKPPLLCPHCGEAVKVTYTREGMALVKR